MPKDFDIQQVRSKNELRAVGALRYKCFLADDLIHPDQEEILLDKYDYATATQTFAVKHENAIVGTIRLHILNKASHRSATMSAFSDILMPKILSGSTIIDGARFAIDPDLGAYRILIARLILRQYLSVARANNAKHAVAAVPVNRIELYQRLYGYTQMSEPRAYSRLKIKLALIGVDLPPYRPEMRKEKELSSQTF